MLKVTLKEGDYIDAQFLYGKSTPKRLGVYALVVLVLMAIAYFGWQAAHGVVAVGALGGVIGGIIGFVVVRFFYMPWKAKRVFRQQKSLQYPFEFAWDGESFITRNEKGNSNTPWSDYTKWRENQQMFLLYHSDVMFQMVPKRAFPDDTSVDEFRRALQQTVSV